MTPEDWRTARRRREAERTKARDAEEQAVAAQDFARAKAALETFDAEVVRTGHDTWHTYMGRLEWAFVNVRDSGIRGLSGLRHAHAVWLARELRARGWAARVVSKADWAPYVISAGRAPLDSVTENGALPYGGWGYSVVVRDPELSP